VSRIGRVERQTKETSMLVEVDLDGTGQVHVATGVPFFDHMLDQLGRHGRLDLTVTASGDTEIDDHHTVEDVGIALGQALAEAWGDRAGVERFGDATVPIDECLVRDLADQALL
jgi:imidazoleglycerol-phosphate dehydratase